MRGNIAFYFRLRRWSETAIDDKVQETSRIMGIGFDKLLGRLPRSLSGGEKQRVALARCLSHSPRVLLLDEPFSNLDAALRQQTRGEVKKLVDHFGLTTVFVTHDQSEAVAMGHRIAVMQHGQLAQVGTYQELYLEPVNIFVAGFLGSPSPVLSVPLLVPIVADDTPFNARTQLAAALRATNRDAAYTRLGETFTSMKLLDPMTPSALTEVAVALESCAVTDSGPAFETCAVTVPFGGHPTPFEFFVFRDAFGVWRVISW